MIWLGAVLVACSEAGGEVKGGDVSDAGGRALEQPPFTPDSGTTSECAGTGTKWSDLYRDIFGPTGRAGSCSFQSSCHGSAEAEGTKSGGVQCSDEKGCRQSFFDTGLVRAADKDAPEGAGLFAGLLRLRKSDGSIVGFMPKAPADYVYPDACLERMRTWIRDGAPDN